MERGAALCRTSAPGFRYSVVGAFVSSEGAIAEESNWTPMRCRRRGEFD